MLGLTLPPEWLFTAGLNPGYTIESPGKLEMIRRVIMVMVAKLYKYTKNLQIVFKAGELYCM